MHDASGMPVIYLVHAALSLLPCSCLETHPTFFCHKEADLSVEDLSDMGTTRTFVNRYYIKSL